MNHWVQLVCLVALTALTGPASAQSETADTAAVPRPAKVFVVQEVERDVVRRYPAVVLPSREVEVSFRVSGQVIDLPIRAASTVEGGDVIARIDPRDFENNVAQLESQRDQAQSQLDALRAGAREEEIAALEATVASAQAQLLQAQEALERTQELVDRGVSTVALLEEAQANFRVAQANVVAQQEQLRMGLAGGRAEDIAASEAALRGLNAQLQIARDNLADTVLRAPFSGIVARRDIDNFTNVQAGQTVVLLQQINIVHLAFDIPGPDVTELTANGPGAIKNTVAFYALPEQSFDGEVVEFSVQADQATQTYRGRVAVEVPPDAVILPGMVAQVTSSIETTSKQIMAPLTAIAAQPDGSAFVWKLDAANAVAKQPVTLGAAIDDRVAVLSGLTPGDTIISAGVSRVFDGQTVRPITQVGN